MNFEYEDYSGECLTGEATDILRMQGDLEDVHPEIVEALSGMGDDDLAETTIDYPELMGRLFKRLRKRRQYRAKLKKKFAGLPKKEKRRVIRRLMAKRRTNIITAIIPGSRLARAILGRRASRKGIGRAAKRRAARKKRWAGRRTRRKVRRTARRTRRQARRAPQTASRAYVPDEYAAIETPATMDTMERRELKKERKMLRFPTGAAEPEQIETDVVPQQGLMKFLPLVAAAAVIPFILKKK